MKFASAFAISHWSDVGCTGTHAGPRAAQGALPPLISNSVKVRDNTVPPLCLPSLQGAPPIRCLFDIYKVIMIQCVGANCSP